LHQTLDQLFGVNLDKTLCLVNMLGEIAATLADGEGLQAHAQSARYRINNH
jgi:histidinol dehydrogenase